ncbi:MAG: ATP-dependent zinc metalloprotease FtsH [Bacilli bacterium]|nr:ATP-dependent zinc metalloprotease FtsH [Bacilli bacterium]
MNSFLQENQVVTAEVYDKETVVQVSGSAINSSNEAFKYTVTLNKTQYNNSFKYFENGVEKESLPYSVRFQQEIDAYKAANPDKAKNAYISEVYAFEVSWWDQWGPSIISIIVTVLIAVLLFSMLSRSVNGSNNKAMDFNRSRARKVENSKVRFSDVAGCDEEKAEMVELVEYLKDPKKYTEFGAKLPKGVLLVGHPGTGKTLLAKAVAGEAGVPFFSISGSDFVEMFVGVGAGRVRDMFRKAKQAAPCLVFIDEIDAVGRQRGAGLGGGNDEREQTLNQLLVEMDGFEDNSGIIVIAATNREDVLDPALLRAGRFDRTITVNLPDKAGREAIFKVHSRNKLVDPKVDFAQIAKRTVGFSGADIENIMNEAAILAVRNKEPMISVKDIDEAIDRRIAGPAKSSKGMNADERKRVAYHEAGHAIIGLKLPHSDKVQKITIIPRGRTGGHVLMTPEDDRFLLSKAELEARIIGFLGGRSSEEIFFDDVTTGASNDIEVATQIARSMVTEYGMSSLGPIQYERDTGSVFLGRDYASTQKNFSTQIAFEIDQEVRKIIDAAHAKAREIIEANKADVIKIAETLLDKETITAEEIDAVLAGKAEEPKAEEKKPAEKKPAAKKAPAKKAPAKKVEKKAE